MAKSRILYIEDYPIIQEIYVRVLRDNDFDVDVVSDGAQALEKAKETTYDVILLDLLLPQTNGIEFLAEYRKNTQGKPNKTKVIVLTDFDNPETMKQVQDLGIDDFWVKVENTPHALAEKIKEALKTDK
jgi:CheY-like chemotaxis protein